MPAALQKGDTLPSIRVTQINTGAGAVRAVASKLLAASFQRMKGTAPPAQQGRGVRAPDGSGTGHQFIHFEVRIPRALSPSQRQLIETYGEGEEEMDEDERTRRNAGRR